MDKIKKQFEGNSNVTVGVKEKGRRLIEWITENILDKMMERKK